MRRPILAVFAAGFLARLAHAVSCWSLYRPITDPQEGYYEAGLSQLFYKMPFWSFGGGEASVSGVWRGPLYPTFIAAVESLFALPWAGHVYAAQALVGGLEAALACGLGAYLWSPAAGLAAGLLVALSPDQIGGATSLNLHYFYGAILLGVSAAAARWAEKPTTGRGAMLGLAMAASFLCRSAHYPAPILLALGAVHWHGARRGLRAAAVAGAFMAAGLLPFTARNYFQTGRLVLLDADAGSVNLLAAASGELGSATADHATELAERAEPGFASRPRMDSVHLRRLAVKLILRDPWEYAVGCFLRLSAFWAPLTPWLLLALAGARAGRTPRLEAGVLFALSLSGYAVSGVQDEYGAAAFPLLAAPAAAGLAALAARPRAAREVPALLAAGPAAAVGLLVLHAGFLAAEADAWGWPSRGRIERMDPRLAALLDHGIAEAANLPSPGLAEALRMRARDRLAAGRPADAERDLRRAVLVDPLSEGRGELIAFLSEAGRRADAALEADMGVSAARRRGGAPLTAALVARGLLALSSGRLADAERDAAEAERLGDRGPAVSLLAEVVFRKEGAAPAAAFVERRLRLRPPEDRGELERLKLTLGIMRGRVQRPAAAPPVPVAAPAAARPRPDGTAALRAARESVSALEAGRREEAVALAEKALALDPAHTLALAAAARARLAQRRGDEALAYARRLASALASPSERAQAFLLASRAAELAGRLEEAQTQAQAAAALDAAAARPVQARLLAARAALSPGSNESAGLLARALAADARAACLETPAVVERSRLGRAFFDACIAALPDEPALRLDRGVALFTAGDARAAAEDFRAALAARPGWKEARESLAAAEAALR